MFGVDPAVPRWTLTAPWQKPPLSMNDRDVWGAATGARKDVRTWAFYAAKAARIPRQAHITVVLVWTVPDLRARDAENPMPTMKAACDGLAAPTRMVTKKGVVVAPGALVVPDDTPRHMTKLMPVIRYQQGVSRLVLIVYAARAHIQITNQETQR